MYIDLSHLRDGGYIVVSRVPYEKAIRKESTFYHKLKKELQRLLPHKLERRVDLIKKLMYKDGHMVDQFQYYIRERVRGKGKAQPSILAFYDTKYALRQIQTEFNAGEKVKLSVVDLKNHE